MKLNKSDLELINLASETLISNKNLYRDKNILVASILKTANGNIYKGINLKTSHSVCAEQVAIGQALVNGERKFDTIVTVKFNKDSKIRVISPCGLCRYIIDDLDIDLNVIVEDEKSGKPLKVKSSELLPYPYNRNV